ncbi:TDP-N-acetylfucosamine:lipid II N-acetylfucosaminyltransferase [Salmonella enterica]
MTVLILVLGSAIPHHNHTLPRFFNYTLAPTSQPGPQFMVSGE